MAAMDPNNSSMMPPITGMGMEVSRALNLPKKARMMANTAAQVMVTGLKLRVIITAPVTSA